MEKRKTGRKKESTLWDLVDPALNPLHRCRIETGLSDPGHPDVDYAGLTRWDPKTGEWEAWREPYLVQGKIELKRCRLPERPDTQKVDVKIEKGQVPWWNLRQRAGGRIHVLLGIDGDGGKGWKRICLFDGITAGEVLNKSKFVDLLLRAKSSWVPGDGGPFENWLRVALLR